MSTNTGDPAGTAQRPKPKGIDQATNPRWATAKIIVRGTIVVLSLAASITSLVYCSAPRRWDEWILLSPLYGIPYVSPPRCAGGRGRGSRLNGHSGAANLNSRMNANAKGYHGSHFSVFYGRLARSPSSSSGATRTRASSRPCTSPASCCCGLGV